MPPSPSEGTTSNGKILCTISYSTRPDAKLPRPPRCVVERAEACRAIRCVAADAHLVVNGSSIEAPEPAVEPEPEPAPANMDGPIPGPDHEMAMADAMPAPNEASGEEPVSAPQLEPVLEPVAIGRDDPEPAIKPIVIGNGEAPVAERKRGWWRR